MISLPQKVEVEACWSIDRVGSCLSSSHKISLQLRLGSVNTIFSTKVNAPPKWIEVAHSFDSSIAGFGPDNLDFLTSCSCFWTFQWPKQSKNIAASLCTLTDYEGAPTTFNKEVCQKSTWSSWETDHYPTCEPNGYSSLNVRQTCAPQERWRGGMLRIKRSHIHWLVNL